MPSRSKIRFIKQWCLASQSARRPTFGPAIWSVLSGRLKSCIKIVRALKTKTQSKTREDTPSTYRLAATKMSPSRSSPGAPAAWACPWLLVIAPATGLAASARPGRLESELALGDLRRMRRRIAARGMVMRAMRSAVSCRPRRRGLRRRLCRRLWQPVFRTGCLQCRPSRSRRHRVHLSAPLLHRCGRSRFRGRRPRRGLPQPRCRRPGRFRGRRRRPGHPRPR